MAAKRPTTFSMRMPEDLNAKINEYASEHSCTKAEAMSHFARAGIALEESGGVVPTESASGSTAAHETLQSIEAKLEALQNLPTIDPEPTTTALAPVDIRDKIQAYSKEHDCSEQDALAYYARIGIELSGTTRMATNADVQEINARIEALAQDSQRKTEQLAQMADVLEVIREYTKPEELILEGEIADDAEDVELEPELTPEEMQRLADERTRQIVSDVMEEYAAKHADENKGISNAQWIPILAAIIVSLIIGLVVILIFR